MKKLLKAAIFIALGGIAGMCFALGSDQSDWTAAGLIKRKKSPPKMS